MKRTLILALAFLLWPSLSIADPQLDKEPGVQPQALRGIQGGTGMIPVEVDVVSGGGGPDPATATLQTTLNTLITTIDGVLDNIKLDTANISSDQATATLQTTLNTLITTIDGVLDAIKLDTANIDTNTSDNATQTTLAAMNAKFVTGTDIGDVDILSQPQVVTDIELNTDTATKNDSKAVVVGTSATLVLASDVGTREVTILNMFTDIVACGPSDITLNTVDATDGFVLAASGAANDGTGGSKTWKTTTAMYCIGTSASSKVGLDWQSD